MDCYLTEVTYSTGSDKLARIIKPEPFQTKTSCGKVMQVLPLQSIMVVNLARDHCVINFTKNWVNEGFVPIETNYITN